jgi:hypothetical protein
VFVLIENLDVAAARAIQYARTLTPDELRAVHFVLDREHADNLIEEWGRLGLSRLPLELIDVPDRRITRVAVELCAETLMDGETEVSLLLPRRAYTRAWHRLLHDKTADAIAAACGVLPHANVTFVPYHLGQAARQRELIEAFGDLDGDGDVTGGGTGGRKLAAVAGLAGRRATKKDGKSLVATPEAPIVAAEEVPEGVIPIAEVAYRQRARVAGRIKSQRVQPWAGVATLECVIVDGTGGLNLVFLGRKQVAGLAPGVRLVAEGTVGDHGGKLAILNPLYRILPEPDHEAPPTHH